MTVETTKNSGRRRYLARVILLTCLFVFWVSSASAQGTDSLGECGSLNNNYGPFDYTNEQLRAEKLPRVEKAHFDSGVRALEGHRNKTFTWVSFSGDIAYTLRVFPNHHSALYVMSQYYIRGYDENLPMQYTPECWFERAHRMAPGDGNVWLIEGIYQARTENFNEAEQSYQTAIKLMPDASEPHYNIGLLYVETENYSLALEHAKRAYGLGYPMPGLRLRLEKLGIWE